MKSLIKWFCFIVIILLSAACVRNQSNEALINIKKEANIDAISSLNLINQIAPKVFDKIKARKYSTYFIAFFDASCATCISNLLTFIHEVNNNPRAHYIYVGTSSKDLLLLEYYLEQNNIKLKPNEVLICDSTNICQNNNRVSIDLFPVVIIDSLLCNTTVVSMYELNQRRIFDLESIKLTGNETIF